MKDPARVQHRPFMTPIWVTILGSLFGMVGFICIAWVWGTADSTTVVIVRLAAPASQTPEHPAADSAVGALRDACVARLARLFGQPRSPDRIDALYVTPAPLEQSIVAPLAAQLGLEMTTADAGDLARRVLREHAGGRVVVVTIGSNADGLVKALGGASPLPPIDGDEGDLYFVSVPRIGRTNLLHMTL